MKRSLVLLFVLLLVAFGSALQAQDATTITIRCKASPPEEDWRCNNFAEVEAEVEMALGIDIDLNLIQDNIGWGDYKQEFVLAGRPGKRRISSSAATKTSAPGARPASSSRSATSCPCTPNSRMSSPRSGLASSSAASPTASHRTPEARPIFYSKVLLADLGWDEEAIEGLPAAVAAGEFTFNDLIATAAAAVEEGVVEEGNGFWHRPSNGPDFLYYYYGMGGGVFDDMGNLAIDSDALLKVYELLGGMTASGIMRADLIGTDWNQVWHPTVATGDTVLFAAGGTWNWPNWAINYVADQGGDDYLTPRIGLTLIPAMETGNAITLTHPLSYMISADAAERGSADVAMALIAAVTTWTPTTATPSIASTSASSTPSWRVRPTRPTPC